MEYKQGDESVYDSPHESDSEYKEHKRSEFEKKDSDDEDSIHPSVELERRRFESNFDSNYGDSDEEEEDDFSPKFETKDLQGAAMNAKLISFLIFFFAVFAMIFFAQGSALAIIYLFVLLPLSLFGLYGAFMFHKKGLMFFSYGIFAWVVLGVFIFGIMQVPSIDMLGEIAKERCKIETFRCEIQRFGIKGFPDPIDDLDKCNVDIEEVKANFRCERVVKNQLIWQTWGTVFAFALLMASCAYSVRKFYKKVKSRSEADMKSDEMQDQDVDEPLLLDEDKEQAEEDIVLEKND